jgi:Putative peptidoglycan binding domain
MLSTAKCMSAVVLASALLLFTSPLAAALRSKASSHSAARISATHSELRASTRTASHRSAVTAAHLSKTKGKVQAVRSSKPRFHGQQAIDQERTLEIQQALIREHYLDGEATGEWDQPTRDALTRFQSDNHWQTKVLPDARALIKLGLGPSQQNLLNPESAALAVPYQSGLDGSAQAGSN